MSQVVAIPVDTPGERHTVCGDLIEWDSDGTTQFPCCKTCGEIPKNEIEVW